MLIRVAQAADAPEIAQIHVETWRAVYRGHISDAVLEAQNVERRAKFWRERLEQAKGAVFVAEDNDAVVGFCDLIPSRDKDANPQAVAEIAAIYIFPKHWRKGAGQLLCNSVLAEARQRNYKLVTLWVLASNNDAICFYEAIGFRLDGTAKTEKMADNSELYEVRFCINLG